MAVAGGCLCGAVRFDDQHGRAARRAPMLVPRMPVSRRGSGAAGAVFLKEGVTVSGPLTDFVIRADSGSVMHRRFCSDAARPYSARPSSAQISIFVSVGALDIPNLATPSATIWTKSAPVWACFDPSLPRIEGQPPPAKT